MVSFTHFPFASTGFLRLLRFAVYILCLQGCTLVQSGSRNSEITPLPERPGIEELLLDETAFPQGWKSDAAGPQEVGKAPLGGQTSIERTVLSFHSIDPSVGATEEIHRYSTTDNGEKEYNRQLELLFPEGEFWLPWVIPADLNFESSFVDEFYFACSEHGTAEYRKPVCRLLARYKEYLVKLSVDMSQTEMTYQDLQVVFQAVDSRMTEKLK